ncbi:MAG: helix-turn-helix transcriptional regulator [Streptomycetaceae bacterium]|nr:helix-turn-helix transcriptional regulator [Streptomycetaceae bacterium]
MAERQPFEPSTAEIRLTDVLGALADPVRLELAQLIERTGNEWGESSCSQYADLLGIHKSTVSHHLKVLREAGLTRTRVDGRNRWVRLRRDDLDARFPGLLGAVLESAPEHVAR